MLSLGGKWRRTLVVRMLLVLIATCAAFSATLAAENIMIQEDNMKELNCSLPNDQFRLLSTNAPAKSSSAMRKSTLS